MVGDIPLRDLRVKVSSEVPNGKTPGFLIEVELEVENGVVVAAYAMLDYVVKVHKHSVTGALDYVMTPIKRDKS